MSAFGKTWPANLWFYACGFGLLATLVFLAFPKIDLSISGAFYVRKGTFSGQSLRLVQVLRGSFSGAFYLVIGASLVGLVLTRHRARRWLNLDRKQWLFLAICLSMGPGILANVVLKDHWGRARPKQVVEFGGAKTFTPPLIPTGRERHRAEDQNLHEVEDAGRATSSPGQDPRGHLRERTEPHQGDYRCHSRLGRFKIILENQGTAEALTMSASGQIILLFSGLSVAAYVIWSGTGKDVTVRPDQEQQQDQVSNPASSGKSVFSRSGEPSSSIVEPTVVTILERPVKRSVAPSPLPRSRDAIGRELQKELKRVGCYAGELNGEWTTSTRHAMSAFAERVNARLPTVQPDSILLALVQGYPTKVCGIPCPSGQSLSRTQECTPDALLARSNGTKLTADRGQQLTK